MRDAIPDGVFGNAWLSWSVEASAAQSRLSGSRDVGAPWEDWINASRSVIWKPTGDGLMHGGLVGRDAAIVLYSFRGCRLANALSMDIPLKEKAVVTMNRVIGGHENACAVYVLNL